MWIGISKIMEYRCISFCIESLPTFLATVLYETLNATSMQQHNLKMGLEVRSWAGGFSWAFPLTAQLVM